MTILLLLLLAAVNCGPVLAQDKKAAEDRTLLTQDQPLLAEWDAQVTNANGDVTVVLAGEAEEIAASKGMPLQNGDRIKTGADSSAEISFEGNSVILLRSHSDFTLQSLSQKETVFRLALGSILAKIQSLAGMGSLSVHTPTAIAAVRGTEFGVEIAADSQATHVGVFDEGKVEVRGAGAAGPSETLLMNQETQVFRGQHPVAAYQLKQFAKHRSTVRSMRKRMQILRKSWKHFSPKERREARGAAIVKFKEHRKKVRAQAGERKAPKQRALRPDEEKMRKFKEQIRNRRRQKQQP